MRRLIGRILCYIGLKFLSLRYSISLEGYEKLTKEAFKKKGGILFLPNHPAHVDPIILALLFWPKFRVRPLVIEYIYRQSGIYMIMKLLRALSIPNLETSLNELKIKKSKEVLDTIIRGLKKKENFLLYPGGRLKHTGKESLGGSSAAHYILEQVPQTNVVLIRTTGLWGSSFSRAYEGKSPDFKKTFRRGLIYLLKNCIFFMPRRKIKIQIELASKDFPFRVSRLEFNRYLEDWYNQYPVDNKIVNTEPLNRVSYLFWKKTYLEVQESPEKKVQVEKGIYSSEMEEVIIEELSHRYPEISVRLDMSLSRDLGMDSLDIAELITWLSVRFEIKAVHPQDVDTVRDLLEIAEGKKKIERMEEEERRYTWPKEEKRPVPELPEGKTILEVFFHVCDRMKHRSACGDDLIGVLSYKKLKIAILALQKEIRKIPSSYVGVLLPASIGSYMVILAIMAAGKIPVMLNWTLGPRYLNHMIELTKTNVVISSWKFMERGGSIELGQATKKIQFLEDIKRRIGQKKKMLALYYSFHSAKKLLKLLRLDSVNEDSVAVILFTSGTEAAPKGVPLTHRNILSNLRAAMRCVSIYSNDILFGILPPFHSFGFSVAGLFPLLGGIRVAFFPDPTDSYALAEGIERWKITLFCAAPSFLAGLLQAARKKQLISVRLFITGAEKTPKELFRKVALLGEDKKLVEGYGITECSPIISLNRPDLPTRGVGQLLPGIEGCIVHPETKELLAKEEEGEICVRGPSIFHGYLGKQKSPFIEIEGKQWYRTGDLGYFDEKGNLILSGRLKRFVKIGGEMISLTGLEEVISSALFHTPDLEEGPSIAICASEKEEGKAIIILFTTHSLDKNFVNELLQKAGFSRLVKISVIKKIDHIPLLGTGKIDYQFLQTLID